MVFGSRNIGELARKRKHFLERNFGGSRNHRFHDRAISGWFMACLRSQLPAMSGTRKSLRRFPVCELSWRLLRLPESTPSFEKSVQPSADTSFFAYKAVVSVILVKSTWRSSGSCFSCCLEWGRGNTVAVDQEYVAT